MKSQRRASGPLKALQIELGALKAVACDTRYSSVAVGMRVRNCWSIYEAALTALTRPPSERPVAQVREALDKLADKISAKVVQLQHYRDHGCQLDHARIIAEGRLQQAQQILHWVAEAAVNFAPALTAERPEAAVAMIERSEFEIVRKASRLFEDAANAWMERALKAEAALAIQHEEPGRETMTSVPKPDYLLRGGPGFDYPCANPNIIECADDRCQEQQRCRKSPNHSPPHRGI